MQQDTLINQSYYAVNKFHWNYFQGNGLEFSDTLTICFKLNKVKDYKSD